MGDDIGGIAMKTRVSVLVAVMVLCGAAHGVERQLIDLGTLGGTGSTAYGINDSGQVVGSAKTNSSTYHAFVYSNGSMTDLNPAGASSSDAYAINNSAQVSGRYRDPVASTESAAIWTDGQATPLGTLAQQSSGEGWAINSSGQVAGSFLSPTAHMSHAFLYDNGTLNDIGTLGGKYGYARGINDSKDVVGFGTNAAGKWHAFIYRNGIMSDIGTLGGSESYAQAINNSGQAVGYASLADDSQYSAFLYYNGVMTDIGGLGGFSVAYAINDRGQVVGSSRLAGSSTVHAFLWEGGAMTDLNTLLAPEYSGWTLTFARGINEGGWICGEAVTPDGQTHAYLLTPEPTMILLLGMGGIALRRMRRPA
jgi:probable HAF family extracellular repeat protein